MQALQHQRYGKMYREKWGTKWQVHVSDPELIEKVYRHEGRYPHRPGLESWILYRRLIGKPNGLFTAWVSMMWIILPLLVMKKTMNVAMNAIVVILAASDPTYTAVHCRRSCVSGGCIYKAASGTVYRPTSPQLQRWLFSETASKLVSFPDWFLPNCFWFLVLYTVYSSGVAVLNLNHSK